MASQVQMAGKLRVRKSAQPFDRFLDALDPDRTRAGELYVAVHDSARDYFENHNCPDARGQADRVLDVMCEFVNRKRVKRLHNPKGLAYRIAKRIEKRIWATMYRDVEIRPDELPESPAAQAEPENVSDPIESRSCEEICLRQLSRGDRELLIAYHQRIQDGPKLKLIRKNLAKELGITITSLRKRVCKILRILDIAVEHCKQEK